MGASAQAELVETLQTDADRVVIDLGIIDHLRLTGSEGDQVKIKAVNAEGVPRTELKDEGRTLFISSSFTRQIQDEPMDADKLCSVEPVYPSFDISIPRGGKVLVSIGKGNLYAERYEGDMELQLEEGVVRLDQMEGSVKVEMNRGRIWISGLDRKKVRARTRMGELVLQRSDGTKEDGNNFLEEDFGRPTEELEVITVMGSIYLRE